MSTPTLAAMLTAYSTLATIASEDINSASGLQDLRAMAEDGRAAAKRVHDAAVAVTVSGANIAALKTVFETAKGSTAVVGDVFRTLSTADTTDTVCATAKGSAPVVGDYFRWTNVGTPAIEFFSAPASTFFAAIDAALA